MNIKSFLALFLLFFLVNHHEVFGENISVRTEVDGNSISVEAGVRVNANRSVIWSTLTDYNNLSAFIRDMTFSQIQEREQSRVIVRQIGVAQISFLRLPIKVTLEVQEVPPYEIRISAIKGNLKNLEARYTLKGNADDDHWIIQWSGVMEPKYWMPNILSTQLIRRNIVRQMNDLASEIARRSLTQSFQ